MKTIKPMMAALLVVAPLGVAQAQGDMPAKAYVAKAGASDMFERQSADLMMRSANPKVRAFATMMKRDHSASTTKVKAAAMSAHLRVAPPMLDDMQASNLAALRAARGADRDRLYIDQQKMAHRDALTLQQGYASDGNVASLRMAASKIVPVVQHHITMLDAM